MNLMNHLMNRVKRFVLDESALELVEWGVVAGVVAVVGTAIYLAIAGDVASGLGNLSAATNVIP
jgi:Flp pilus assembly pilin Flp